MSGNLLTTAGASTSTDLFLLTNSAAYTDFTMQVQVRDLFLQNNHRVGIRARYRDDNNYYSAVLANGSVRAL